MSDVWYYAKGGGSVGPFTLAELAMNLSFIPEVQDVLVWRDGFEEWRRAQDVFELAPYIIKKPSLPRIPTSFSYNFADVRSPKKTKQVKSPFRRTLGLALLVGLLAFITYSHKEDQREKEAEENYYKAHPLTEKQETANKHFNTCYQYRHTPTSVWSDNQRKMMLLGEACYPDDRDDPRYGDATYPYNA